LEPALVVPLPGRSMSKSLCPDFAGHLQAALGDQWPCDRRSEQIYAFVLGLPAHHRKGKIAAKFLARVDNPRRRRTAIARLFQNRVAIFTGLAKIDVGTMHLVAFILQPAQNDRSIKTAGIRKDAGRHGKNGGSGMLWTGKINALGTQFGHFGSQSTS